MEALAMLRIALLVGGVLLLLAPIADALGFEGSESEPRKLRVYIGTYTGPGSNPAASRGIYQLELDLASGTLTPRGLAAEAVNPSFLAVHPSRRFLYAVGEVNDF